MKLKTIFTLVLLSGSLTVQAADKIAMVDFSQVYSKMPELQVVAEKMNKEFKPEIDKLKAREVALNKDVKVFQGKSEKLNQKELAEQQNKLQDQRAKLESDAQSFVHRKDAWQQKERDLLVKKVQSFIKDVASSKGYNMVVDKTAVAWSDDQNDLTDEVIKAIK